MNWEGIAINAAHGTLRKAFQSLKTKGFSQQDRKLLALVIRDLEGLAPQPPAEAESNGIRFVPTVLAAEADGQAVKGAPGTTTDVPKTETTPKKRSKTAATPTGAKQSAPDGNQPKKRAPAKKKSATGHKKSRPTAKKSAARKAA